MIIAGVIKTIGATRKRVIDITEHQYQKRKDKKRKKIFWII